MREFKVAYANCEDVEAVVKEWMPKIDAEGFSVWYFSYDPAEGECED